MKNFNLLRKSERKSVGTTLALTVGSPSFDRRGTMLKHYAFMLLFLLGSLNVWGTEETWSWTLATGNNLGTASNVTTNPSGSKTLTGKVGSNEVAKYWDFAMVSGTSKYYLSGAQIGSGTNYCTSVTLSTSAFTQTIKNVKVTSKCGSKAEAKISISVGGTTYVEEQPLTKTETVYGMNSNTGTATGDIVIKLSQPSTKKALYISKVEVIYEAGGASLKNIEITGTPETTSYEQGQSFDPTGLIVTAYYDDNSDEVVTEDVEWSFAPAAFTATGENQSVTATATYNEKTDSKTFNNITVAEHVVTAGTYDITFNNAFFGTTGLNGSLSGANLKDYSGSENDITVEYKKGTGSNMYLKDSEIRLYSGNTLVITAPSGYNITSVTGLKSTMTANEGTITDTEWSGESNSVTFSHNNTTGNSSLATISVTYAAVDMSKPATPEFSVAAGTYTEAQSIELSCTTDGATIYYTTDGSTPDNTSTEYTGSAISLSERGTYTIKAIAIKGEDASAVASATYTINLPYIFASVSELFTYLDENSLTTLNDVTVTGYVSEIVTKYSTQYGNISFNISDDGSTTAAQLQSYRGKGTDASSIEVGDKVTISGNYKVHNSTKELDQGNTITNRIAKGAVTAVVVSGTATKNTYSTNETFETAGLVVTATYANGFSEVVTEGITWGNDLTDGKVTESTTVHVTATVGGVPSDAYGVDIVVSTKALVSIALSAVEFEVYQGLELPKPIVTATYSEGEPEDVTAWAEFTGYDKTTPGEQTITVSYSFGGGEPIVETYTVTVKPIYNVELAAGVAKTLIETVVGETESTEDMIVRGIVSHINNASNNVQTYWISDDGKRTNEVEIYKGKYLSEANFTTTNQLKVGDEVVVKGKVVYYNSTTPEFASGKSQLQSLARTPNFKIADVTGFEVGADDLAVVDLTITKDGEGEVTLASSDKEEFVTIEGGKLHAVAPGTATITANLAANGIYKAATYEFSVTVIAAQVKYAITFDDNGADGGEDPEAIADKAAGAEVTLPANTWTKEGFTFTGWKVFNNSTSAEVEVVAGAFEMPASAVTIKAQWAEIPVWAYTYTSNITVGTDKVVINTVEYAAKKTGTNSAFGSTTIEVPTGATTLHFHAAGWGADAVVNLEVKKGETLLNTFALTTDAGVKSNSPFTLKGTPYLQYYSVALSEITEPTTITFKAKDDGGKRFVLYGVNQEGGIVPASIAANPASISFGSVEQNAPVAAKTINVTLTSVNSATVTLAGDDAFSIDKTSLTESGTITVTPNTATEGTYAATITISDVAEEADDVVVNVSMTVTEPVINDDVTGTWNLVTDAADLMPGMKAIVAQSVNASGTIYTMGKQNSNNRAQVESTVDGETLSPAVGTKVITLVDAGNGMFALQTSNGKYLSAAGSGTNNHLKEADDYNSNQEKWTITIADNKAKIQAASTNRNTIRYNSGNSIFSCYAENGQAAIALYAKPFDYTRNVSGNYATICLPKAGKIIGATLYEIAYYGEASKKIFFDEIVNGEMEAGIPYIFQPAAGVEKINVYYSDNTAEDVVAGDRNGLIGFYNLTDPTARHYITQDEGFYILYNNQYWLVSGREAYVENYRAFIQLNQIRPSEPTLAPGRRRISMSVNDTQTTTGFENAEANEAPRKVLINGELFILRGEKMYDAKGQLVK